MAVRMVLVSLVASLGLNLPNSDDLNRWTRPTHVWLDTQLAAWDARMPTGTQAFVYFAESDVPEPAAVRQVAEPAVSPVTVVKDAPADLEDVFAEVFPSGEAPAAEPTAPALVSDADFAIAMTDVVALFTVDSNADAEIAATETAIASEPTKDAKEELVPEISDQLAAEIAAVFETETECLLKSSEPAEPTFEPLVVAVDLSDDFAYELNRLSDGRELHDSLPATVREEANSTRSDRIVHAFRLTREAALAWANLLHAPAVVTISH